MENSYKTNGRKSCNAGLYLRLSKEDEENTVVSQSIINQKDFLTTYAIENAINIVDYYIDDGYSGTSFDRPDFNRLIEDIEKGRINTVITKDLSRLGRDYITTGHYMEKYFPSKNVRYIAINDGIDTEVESTSDITPFKAVLNDMYAKDISKKTRTAKTTKMLKGEFIGAIAPYGYRKSESNKNKLVIDEETACIVRRIFDMAVANMSMYKISTQLSLEKIPTPSEAKKLTVTQRGIYKGLWNVSTVKRILTNPTYIGNLTQNRTKKVNYKVKKCNEIPKENWIIIPNTHEAIVTEEDFNTVQSLLSKRNYASTKREAKSIHLLSGLVVCGDCGKAMTYTTVTRKNRHVYLVCSTRRRYGKLAVCSPKSIREDRLEKAVISKIREVARKHVDKDSVIENADMKNKQAEHASKLTKEKAGLSRQLEEMQRITANLYKDKVRGIISEEDFIIMSGEFSKERERLKVRREEIESEQEQAERAKDNMPTLREHLEKFLEFEEIDRLGIVTLIDRIEVYRDKRVEVRFNFYEA